MLASGEGETSQTGKAAGAHAPSSSSLLPFIVFLLVLPLLTYSQTLLSRHLHLLFTLPVSPYLYYCLHIYFLIPRIIMAAPAENTIANLNGIWSMVCPNALPENKQATHIPQDKSLSDPMEPLLTLVSSALPLTSAAANAAT